jgi:hypothetical protein
MTTLDHLALAAREFGDDTAVVWRGGNASDPVWVWGDGGWTSTPFQNAGTRIKDIASWLNSEGGMPSSVADLHSDGSATLYSVEMEEDEDGDLAVAIRSRQEIDAPRRG